MDLVFLRFWGKSAGKGFPQKTQNPKTDFVLPKSSPRRISIKKSKLGFHGFVILRFWGKSEIKKDLQICTREQRSMFHQFCARNHSMKIGIYVKLKVVKSGVKFDNQLTPDLNVVKGG